MENFADPSEAQINAGATWKSAFTYKGRTQQVPVQYKHYDNAIAIHTLAQLVRDDTELRFCIDSGFNNVVAFLALPPSAWQALEADYGNDTVAFRFTALPADLESFIDNVLFKIEHRDYPDDAPLHEPDPLDEVWSSLQDSIQEMARPIDDAIEIVPMLVFDKFLHLLVIAGSRAKRDALHRSAAFKAELNLLPANLAPLNWELQSVAFEAQEVIASNPAAFYSKMWWEPGRCLQVRWDERNPPDYKARVVELGAALAAAQSPQDSPGASSRKQWWVLAAIGAALLACAVLLLK
jgi:hypothetical protein